MLQTTIASPFGRGHVLGAAGDLGEERVADVRDDQADERGAPARSVAAEPFGTQPSVLDRVPHTLDACRSATRSGRLTTFETVPTETPARSATSLIVIAGSRAIARTVVGG